MSCLYQIQKNKMTTTSIVMPNDLSDLCRVCLQLPEESQYLDLNTIYDEDDNLTYSQCFTICTQIYLTAGQGVPHHLCKSCGLELQMSYDFRKKVDESNRVLQQYERQMQEDVIHQQKQLQIETQTQSQQENINPEQHHLDESIKVLRSVEDHTLQSQGSLVQQDYISASEEEEENAVDMLLKISPGDNVQDISINMGLINSLGECVGVEEHLELEDFQNIEALEEEDNIVYIPPINDVTSDIITTLTEQTEDPEISVSVDIRTSITEEKAAEEISQFTNKCSTNLPDKASVKETHKNLQQFIVNDSLHLTRGSVPDIVIPADLEQTATQRTPAVCNICHKSFVNHSKLNWHKRMHDMNRKRFVCPIDSCGRLYASKQSCDLHYRQSHLDEGLCCPICHKVFSVKQTLEVHMRYHTKDYPYACNLCSRKFAQKGHLTQHIEVKHQNLRYICTEPDCGKIFQNSVSLKNHRYTHSGMPFKCCHCDKKYPQKNKLRIHLLRKHNLEYSLNDLETMRQFQSIRTRHTYVKVQTVEVEESVDGDSDNSQPIKTEFLEELDVGM